MSLLNRYIGSHVIWSTAVVVFVLIGIESFMEFVTQLSDIGVGHYGVFQAMLFVPLLLPTDLYQLFPMAGFLGSLIGLGRLASTSQLIVMRAAGVSVLQIAWAVIRAALLMIIVVTVIGEGVAPHMQQQAESIKRHAMGKVHNTYLDGVWLKGGNTYAYIDVVRTPTTMENITRFDFNQDGTLSKISQAHFGHLINKHWILSDLQASSFREGKVFSEKLKSEPLGIVFKPAMIKSSKEKVDQESLYALFNNILYRREAGLVTSQYQYAFWKRMIQPITTIVMICLGIPFIFGSLRSASTGLRIMTGVIIGFGFYMLNQFFGPITLVYQFPPLLAASLPTVLFVLAYAILLSRARRLG